MRSLRTRLFVYLIGGAAALLLVAGFALSATIAALLQSEFDRTLEAKARALVALTEREADRIEFDFRSEPMPEFGDAGSPEYFELWLADGSLVRRSPSFDQNDETRGASLVKSPPPAATPSFRDVRLPDGRRGRQIQIDFVPSLDAEADPAETKGVPAPASSSLLTATLLVARERERLDAGVRRLELTVAGLGVGLLVALAGLMQLALRVGGDGWTGVGELQQPAENLEPQDLAVMFDRFWRKDEARAGGRNVGLGLALVRALADLLEIEIETRLLPDRTFRVTLSRPVAG